MTGARLWTVASGYGTRACVIADGGGRAVAFLLAPGQAHEASFARRLLALLPGTPLWVVADRGYTGHAFREHVWDLGAHPAIPPQRREAPVACPVWVYNNRNIVERSGAAEGVACRRNPLRGDRHLLTSAPSAWQRP